MHEKMTKRSTGNPHVLKRSCQKCEFSDKTGNLNEWG